MMILRLLVLWLLAATVVNAQEKSIVCIKLPNGYIRDPDGSVIGVGQMAGTGSIVSIDETIVCQEKGFEGWVSARVLTAAHVVDGKEPINCHLRGGEVTRLRVLIKGSMHYDDIALCTGFIPPGYEALPICRDHTELLDNVTAHGLAGLVGKWPVDARRVDGQRIGRLWHDGRAYYDLVVRPGDSGGPIMVDGKIVGIVSGGLMSRQSPGDEYFNTWPLVSVTPGRIRELVK